MILVDSSVWIDFLNGNPTPAAQFLDERMLRGDIVSGDLILGEVLQGVRNEREFDRILRLLKIVGLMEICDVDIAIAAARNYRHLRVLGITVRKTIDTLIATRCIEDDIPLLYSDRDFEPFRQHLGLVSAMDL